MLVYLPPGCRSRLTGGPPLRHSLLRPPRTSTSVAIGLAFALVGQPYTYKFPLWARSRCMDALLATSAYFFSRAAARLALPSRTQALATTAAIVFIIMGLAHAPATSVWLLDPTQLSAASR